MSHSDNAGFAAEPQGADPSRPRGNRVLVIALVSATIALVTVPIVVGEWPHERARWQAAKAIEAYVNGDLSEALVKIEQAIELDPNSSALYRYRAALRLDAKEYEGSLADLNRAIQLAPRNAVLYMERSVVYQHLGRHELAVADWDKVVQLNKGRDIFFVKPFIIRSRGGAIELLNARAYARAVGNMQLEDALADVNSAIEKYGKNAAFRDTRGFIHYRLGVAAAGNGAEARKHFEAAREDLEAAVPTAEEDLAFMQQNSEERGKRMFDVRDLPFHIEQAKQTVAVLRYHRGLLYQAMGESKLAEDDFRRVTELGYEPNDDLF